MAVAFAQLNLVSVGTFSTNTLCHCHCYESESQNSIYNHFTPTFCRKVKIKARQPVSTPLRTGIVDI